MARKLKSVVIAEEQASQAVVINHGTFQCQSGVKSVALSSRRLVTVQPSDFEFDVGDLVARGDLIVRLGVALEGAIVRVQPPATATDVQIDQMLGFLKSAGVAQVRVEPRLHGDAVLQSKPATVPTTATKRDVVMRMVDEVHAGVDKKRLRLVLDAALSKEGI